MKKTLRQCAFAVAVVAAFMPFLAMAHFLEIDGSVGGVLHVDPDDSPIAGDPASAKIYLTDKAGHIDLTTCDCSLDISEANGSSALPRPSVNYSTSSLSFVFTFPTRGVYLVTVKGAPKAGADFKPFTLSYDVRVDREQSVAASGFSLGHFLTEHGIHILFFGSAFFVSGAVIVNEFIKERRRKRSLS